MSRDKRKDRRDPKLAFRSPDALNIFLYRGRLNAGHLSLVNSVGELLETSGKAVHMRLAELGAP